MNLIVVLNTMCHSVDSESSDVIIAVTYDDYINNPGPANRTRMEEGKTSKDQLH